MPVPKGRLSNIKRPRCARNNQLYSRNTLQLQIVQIVVHIVETVWPKCMSPPHRPLLTAPCSPPVARRPLLILHSATQSLDPTAAPMDLASLQALPGNSFCADCSSTNPDWASCNNGVLLCLHCAGAHRGLGTHISFVQSVTMDTISPNNRLFIASSSNNAFHDFVYYNYMVNKPPTPCSAGDRVVIRAKYDNERANEYRNGLRKLANLDPVPYFPTQPNTTAVRRPKKQPSPAAATPTAAPSVYPLFLFSLSLALLLAHFFLSLIPHIPAFLNTSPSAAMLPPTDFP